LKKKNKPESEMMSYGYDPHLSEGAAKTPLFQTSTFVFKNSKEGRAYFEVAYGLRKKKKSEDLPLSYARINNPNAEIAEERLKLWDKAESCALFQSGMAAISTSILELSNPGGLILHSSTLYGGTNHFIKDVLPKYNISSMEFDDNDSIDKIISEKKKKFGDVDVNIVYIESPANPTNQIIDIEKCALLAKKLSTKKNKALLLIDNTFMGPIWSKPIDFGADIVLYSVTKYLGGHSDIVAGAALGEKSVIDRIKSSRVFFGNISSPFTSWLLLRSLETLKIRMEKEAETAFKIAKYLEKHSKIKKVNYLGLINKSNKQYKLYKKQYGSGGAMITIYVKGDLENAYKFLDNLKLIKLAVSLGGTESLACHPGTMTHVDVNEKTKNRIGITNSLVRLSIGLEDSDDLIDDIKNALNECK
tara:strand:+ start:1221 stop:2471 length:1251 start_codon:yes stop_codon:yes gene_type:complete